ncbi:MAG: nitroreductase family protein, partial [Bifidobacteriaceae bacterium]|nr:nitroreductase family protein [Bifidobacteriaceae bacterium]
KTAALVTADSPYIHHVAHDVHGIPESDLVGWRRGFAAFQADALGIAGDDRATADWALRQAYLPLANMMTMAAILGIDSCPMEGYFPEAAATVLAETGAFDPATDRLGPMLALGYRAEGLPWPQTRRPIEEIVHYLG